MRKAIIWVVAILIIVSMITVFSLTGCKGATESTSTSEQQNTEVTIEENNEETVPEEEVAGENEKITEYKFTASSPFESQYFSTWREGIEAAAKKLNVEIIATTSEWDPSKQTGNIKAAISAGANGVIAARVDLDVFGELANELSKENISLVTTDGPVGSGPRVAHFGCDAMQIGNAMGEGLIEALEKSGKEKPWKIVAFAGLPGTYDGMLRIEGAMSAINSLVNDGEIEVLEIIVANFDRGIAMQKMQAMLSIYPKIDAVIAANDDMALGAMAACEGAGLVPGADTIFLGVDATNDALDAIREGKMYGSVCQAPYLEGYWATTTLFAYYEYECEPDFVSIPVPNFLVSTQNIDTFEQEIKFDKPASAEYFAMCADNYNKFIEEYWGSSE